ncbi:LTA synthase family protein [Rhizobiaceae bacterium BDR2-2]|uniref:LTA synthase family protein n=1 Tax=Ectorhizobium quercum TaxID=2965071 RepID=A0AAE3MZX7_9HYPH|nr:LTA synthase family protein [Ectorhizobium quercum]MCX8997526.1 LTA synthase family protein [Ectorhizobium quercum]
MSESRFATVVAVGRPVMLTRARRAVYALAGRLAFPYGMPLMIAFAAVLAMEVAARLGVGDITTFFTASHRPGPTAVMVVFLLLLLADALFGRLFLSLLTVLPPLLVLAFVSGQKRIYLSDPLYPSDLPFGARQIFELLPAMVESRPVAAAGTAAGIVALVAALAFAWIRVRPRLPVLGFRSRMVRVAIALPLLAGFAAIMDYREISRTRDRLGIIPIIWDQAENYRHNGFLLAFTLNLPMASIGSPAGYGAEAIDAIPARMPAIAGRSSGKPDVIMIMSESLWDPTRLGTVALTPDPLAWMRRHQSGNVFSPEFGGMTSNVEFEALTGFSNAFLPAGSIPYQQYIRGSLPSLATFFRGEGYTTLALHPFQGWFWNRDAVYNHMGFEAFLSQENLPAFSKRGMFAADEDFTEEMMRQADGQEERPFFMFAVTLQGHGPYEPNRYRQNTISVDGPLSAAAHAAVSTYAQGVREADDSLRKLMDWAKRRKRETIIVFFGDHLPPLGAAYVQSGMLPAPVPSRNAEPETLRKGRETPLMIWSSRAGIRRAGVVSPSFLPFFTLKMAGFEHPYYTGVLGRAHEKYAVIDRHMLLRRDGTPVVDWNRGGEDETIRNLRLLQYDLMFGKGYALDRFFPSHLRVNESAGT